MAELIGAHWEGDVWVEWWGDRATEMVTVVRKQDCEKILGKVADISAEGAPSVDGMGRSLGELPAVPLLEHCAKRGIEYAGILRGHHDDEIRRFLQDNSKLAYSNHRAVKAS